MAIDLQELATAIGKLVIRFRMRRHTTADWVSLNEVLLSAEWGVETDGLKRKKVGDGVTGWNALPFDSSGIQTIVAGDGIDVDDTDPFNPIVSATGSGGGGGGGSSPWPDGCIMWFATSHRNGVTGHNLHYLNAPEDYPGRGLMAASGGAFFNSIGGVAAGGVFNIQSGNPLSYCTIMAVIITPPSLGVSTIMSGSGSGALQFRLDNSSGNWHLTLVVSGVAGIGDDSGVASLAPSTMYLVTATFSATTNAWTLRRNGVQTASGTSGSGPTTANDRIGISSGGENAQHDLMELVTFDRPLGSTDMATSEGILMTKFSI